MITVGIIGNPFKSEIKLLLKHITSALEEYKINYLLDEQISRLASSKKNIHTAKESKILKDSDYIFSLGGDGTFLNTARIVGNKNIPILGINFGRLGFFSEISPQEIRKFIPDLLNKKFRLTSQTILKTNVKGKILYSMNDIVIDKSDSIRMIETETSYNNEKVVNAISDGIIVSTPAGSTGYSMSCNGPIVNPESRVFIITPISPHALNVRTIIVPDDGEIKIILPKEGKARITADGQNGFKIKSPSEIIVSKADYTIKIIKKSGSTYFDTLKKKLFWNVDKRND